MAAVDGNIIKYIYTGEEDEPPEDATHVSIHHSIIKIPADFLFGHPSIVQLDCHDSVRKIEAHAFLSCASLGLAKMAGVEIVQKGAFNSCKSLSGIDLPSAKMVEDIAFAHCDALTYAKFGKNLELISKGAFRNCPSLQRITIPLKFWLFNHDDVFQACVRLRRVDLIEEEVIRETIDSLQLEEWRDDMNKELDSIKQILPNTHAGDCDLWDNTGGKARAIGDWMTRMLLKIIRFKAKHRHILSVAASIIGHDLSDELIANVMSFLESPRHKFDGEDALSRQNVLLTYS